MRSRILPAHGSCVVSTDVHGNEEDVLALERIFRAEPNRHWVILGDAVHAPDAAARRSNPALYDYADGSGEIVMRISELQREFPERVHFVLGNHDWSHVGGPRTSKFFADEAAELESTLGASTKACLRALFENALLAVAAPCGVLMTHGSPDTALESLAQLDASTLTERSRVLATVLGSYGQPAKVTTAMLARVSAASGLDLRVVVHGHDRSEAGFFYEGGNQVCPVLFGAPRAEKRFALLDLAARYDHAEALRDGHELRRLYP